MGKAIKKAAPAAEKQKYAITECFSLLRNLWAQPEFTRLYITTRAYMKLMAFINLVGDYEITGFGRIQNMDWRQQDGTVENIPTVTDFDIIQQEVKSAYVEADDDAVLRFMMKLPEDQRDEWVLDWHSHVEMGTTPSQTDWNNYEEMSKARLGKQFPAIIVNKQESITAKCYINRSKHPGIEVYVEKIHLNDDELLKIYNECKEKVENLCTKYTPVITSAVSSWYSARKDDTKDVNSNYRDSRVGYGYGLYDDYGYSSGWDSWENSRTTTIDLDDDDDDDVKAAKAAGYVFEDEEKDVCEDCGKKLDLTDSNQKAWRLCSDCINKYMASEK